MFDYAEHNGVTPGPPRFRCTHSGSTSSRSGSRRCDVRRRLRDRFLIPADHSLLRHTFVQTKIIPMPLPTSAAVTDQSAIELC